MLYNPTHHSIRPLPTPAKLFYFCEYPHGVCGVSWNWFYSIQCPNHIVYWLTHSYWNNKIRSNNDLLMHIFLWLSSRWKHIAFTMRNYFKRILNRNKISLAAIAASLDVVLFRSHTHCIISLDSWLSSIAWEINNRPLRYRLQSQIPVEYILRESKQKPDERPCYQLLNLLLFEISFLMSISLSTHRHQFECDANHDIYLRLTC